MVGAAVWKQCESIGPEIYELTIEELNTRLVTFIIYFETKSNQKVKTSNCTKVS